jgi:hypothetical protein
MKIAFAILGAALVCAAAPAHASCGPKAREALTELQRSKTSLTAAAAHLTAAQRRTFNSRVMNSFNSALRGLTAICSEADEPAQTSGHGSKPPKKKGK